MLSPISTRTQPHKTAVFQNKSLKFGLHRQRTSQSSSFRSGESKEAFETELNKLAQQNKPGFFSRKRFQLKENTLIARARFNVKQDPDCLNPFLPYREKLARDSPNQSLKDFDQLVQKILNQSEFYEVSSPKILKSRLQHAYTPKMPENPLSRFLLKLLLAPVKVIATIVQLFRLWLSPVGLSKDCNRIGKQMPAKAKEMNPDELKDAFKTHARPLQEPATRYMIAAGIAQLLHQKPQYADQILQKASQKRPLRFVVSEKKPLLVGGQALPGLNTIFLNGPATWKALENKKHISQHEFVHLLSEEQGMNKLGFMTDDQKKEFKACRKNLKRQFRTQDKSWFGGLKSILPFKSLQANSTGIRSYGFLNNMEFLTVTLDTFMQEPDKLRTTQAGRKLYNLYKTLFKLDPITDLRN